MWQTCQPSTFLCALATPRCESHSVGFWWWCKRGRANVAGATSGASSGLPTSPTPMCSCCCADVVVLCSSPLLLLLLLCCCGRATNTLIMCLCFVLDVGNVHVAFFFLFFNRPDSLFSKPLCGIWQCRQGTTLLVLRAVLLLVRRRRRRCCAAAAVLLLLCCCCCSSCATLIMCVSLLCIPKLCSFTLQLGAVHASSPTKRTVLLLCGPTCSSPLNKTRTPWHFEVYSPNKTESNSRRLHRCCLCYWCSIVACAVLCCCCVTLIIWVCFVFQLRRFNTVIPVLPAASHKITWYVRKTTVQEKKCGLFSEHTYIYFLRDIGPSFFFILYLVYVYQVDYRSALFG